MRSDLWYDEVYSYRTACLPFRQMLHSLLLGGDTNPPLYTLLLHFWLKLSHSDTHIKTLSLVFGLASIAVMYLLGKSVGGIRLAFLSSFLFAVSDSVIRYSVAARPYALFLFLSLLSTFLLLSAIKDKQDEGRLSSNLRGWVWYGVATTLAIYTHWFGLLLLPLHILAMFVYSGFSKPRIFSYAMVLLSILCCCLPLLPFLADQIGIQSTVGGFSWCGKPNKHSLFDLAYFLSGGKNLFVATLIIFILSSLKTKLIRSPEQGSKKHRLFFCAYVLVPIISVAGVSYSLSRYSFIVPRYFLPFIVGVHILIATSLLRIKPKLAIFFIVIFAVSPLVKIFKHRHGPERPYSLLSAEFQNHSDRLVLHLSPMSYYPTLYYRRDSSPTNKIAWSQTIGPGYVLDYNIKGEALSRDNLFEIEEGLRGQSEFYVVRDLIDRDPIMDAMETHLRRNANLVLVSEKRIGNLSLELYKVRED